MTTETEYLNIKQAAIICRVTPTTLRNWEKSGKIKPVYTPGKHRRYTQQMLDEVMKVK